ncbi:hypothetical protein Tsp_15683, partial [Trichinella spiralis]|uniref:hypothetical protein n=1 Tax=Trichinella spiralis TaxID=6334 RepID=UPI0001EFEFE5
SWHVYKFFIKSSRERKVLLRSIKVSRVEAVSGTGEWTAGKLSGLKCDSVEVKVSMRRNSTLSGVRESIEVRRVVQIRKFSKKYLRECPGHSLKANENLHIPLKANIVQ